MAMKRVAAKNVEEYIAGYPKAVQAALKKVRKDINTILPGMEEVISYQIPTFKYKGRAFIAYAAFEDHCSIYTISKSAIEKFSKELEPYHTSGVTLHFTPGKGFPVTLLKKIIKYKLDEQKKAV